MHAERRWCFRKRDDDRSRNQKDDVSEFKESQMNKKIMLTVALLATFIFGCQPEHADAYANRHVPTNVYHAPENQPGKQGDPVLNDEPSIKTSPPAIHMPVRFPEPEPQNNSVIVDGILRAMCDGDTGALFLPKQHAAPDCHEQMALIPYADDDGDTNEVCADITWGSSDPDWASIHHPPNDSEQNVIWGVGTRDIFDNYGDNEPHATFVGCIKNDCAGKDASCRPQLCNLIDVYGIVNLESTWCFVSSLSEDASCEEVMITQDGRFVSFEPWKTHGTIVDKTVSWRVNDLRYEGTIEPSRTVMSGRIVDEMIDDSIGTWSAWR